MDIGQLAGQVFDEYRLVNLIGEGGMSAVYRAYQEELERYVAVKFLSEQLAQDAGYVERFTREAKLAASLEHPHIVPVYDYGARGKVSYVVMRLLNGGTLTDRLSQNIPLRPGEIITLLEAIARALDYAHSRSIVHRDVKPSNIMFDEQGAAYLVDFGIAKALGMDAGLTMENVALGTPAYMAPEQWRGEALTPAVDQYALAAVVYRILTGQLPFESTTSHELMYRHLNEQPAPAHEVNPALSSAVSAVLQRAMAKTPAERYPTVVNFSNALKQAFSAPVAAEATAQVRAVPPPVTQTAPAFRPQVTVAREATPPAFQRPAVPPPPRARKPERGSLFSQLATGGVIGIALLFVLAAVVALGVLYAVTAGRDEPVSQTAVPAGDAAASAQNGTAIAIAPPVSVDFVGMDVNAVQRSDTLYSQPAVVARDAVFSPDGRMLASAHEDGVIRLWRQGVSGSATILGGHSDAVFALEFDPSGTLLASGGADFLVRLWNTATGAELRTLAGHTAAVRDIAFSPEGALLASASEDNTIRIWDTATGGLVRTLNSSARLLAVDFSPDGTLLASGGADAAVHLWSLVGGNQEARLTGHSEEVRSVAFSPDGSLLASSSTDDTIRIWRLDTRQTVHTLAGHGRDVWVVRFNPDGTLLASGGRDNNLRLWEVAAGRELRNLTGHAGWVLGVDFSPDGASILTASGDGSVSLWR